MAETPNLMTIGQFSSLSRLSVRMLRHYDSHGVLVPVEVDPWTGYRRYSPQQLTDAADIRNLRDIGFGVSAISALLAARQTQAWTNALKLQRESLIEEARLAQGKLVLINRMLEHGERNMSINLRRETIPAMTIVSLRGSVPTYSHEGQLWQKMFPLLNEQSIRPIGPSGVIEHNDEFTEHDVDLSIFLPVTPGSFAQSPLEVHELPERDCVIAEVLGSYDQISEAHNRIGRFIADENLALSDDGGVAGRAFNRYLTTPDQVAREELVTEVCQPLAESSTTT